MDLLKTDDQLVIVNRSNEYSVSKKLICKIPYFERMLSHDLLESKENKVELDFDERALEAILNCLEFGYMLIGMETVIDLCNLIDYFGMDNCLLDDCVTFFHDNFNIKDLPIVIPQVTSTSVLINSVALNAFICRHFTEIVASSVWKDYPIEIVDYILKLDLIIKDEMAVFNAIIAWVNYNPKYRMKYLKRLLNTIRWQYLKDTELAQMKSNHFFKSVALQPLVWLGGQPESFDRTKRNFFILIEKMYGTTLKAKIHDHCLVPLFERKIELDESIPLHVVHNEHVSDIILKAECLGIRIDWSCNKYCILDLEPEGNYQNKIVRCIGKINLNLFSRVRNISRNFECLIKIMDREDRQFFAIELLEPIEKLIRDDISVDNI